MSLPLVVTNGGMVRLIWAFGTEGGINVYGARVTAGTTVNQDLADSLGAAIKAAYTTNLGGQQHTNVQLLHVTVRDLRSPNLPEFIDTAGPASGSGAEDLLPPSNSVCLTLRTSLAGKSFRGRTYISGWTELYNTAGGLIDTIIAQSAVGFVTAVKNAMSTNGLTMAVLSRPAEAYNDVRTTFHNDGTTTTEVIGRGKARAGGVTDVVAVESRNLRWETQRRRVNGRGLAQTTGTFVAREVFAA